MATVGTTGALPAPPASASVLGQGIAYPLSFTPNGRLALASGTDLVTQSIQSICMTAPGERVMLPGYGAATSTFEPVDLDRQSLAVRESVAEYEVRARDVSVSDELGPQGRVVRNVAFNVIGEANTRTLTFPLFDGPSK